MSQAKDRKREYEQKVLELANELEAVLLELRADERADTASTLAPTRSVGSLAPTRSVGSLPAIGRVRGGAEPNGRRAAVQKRTMVATYSAPALPPVGSRSRVGGSRRAR